MALTFYWRCDTATLNVTHDYTVGVNVMSPASANADLTANASITSGNGIYALPGNLNEYYRANGITLYTENEGCIGFWANVATWVNQSVLCTLRGNSFANNYTISMTGVGPSGNIEFISNMDTANQSSVRTTVPSGTIDVGKDLFIVVAWDYAGGRRLLNVYSNTGTLLQSSSNTVPYLYPGSLISDTGLRIGESSGVTHSYKIDNFFIGNSYNDVERIHANRNISSYTQWVASGGDPNAITTSMRLIWRSLP